MLEIGPDTYRAAAAHALAHCGQHQNSSKARAGDAPAIREEAVREENGAPELRHPCAGLDSTPIGAELATEQERREAAALLDERRRKCHEQVDRRIESQLATLKALLGPPPSAERFKLPSAPSPALIPGSARNGGLRESPSRAPASTGDQGAGQPKPDPTGR